jgi:hypothetical protein
MPKKILSAYRLPATTLQALNSIADFEGITKTEALIRAIDAALTKEIYIQSQQSALYTLPNAVSQSQNRLQSVPIAAPQDSIKEKAGLSYVEIGSSGNR